jgi:hypothetical protein
MSAPRELRIEQLLGRQLVGQNDEPVGRIEEFRSERRGERCVTTQIVVGMMGLMERLDLGAKLLFGGKHSFYLVRWDQIDVSDPAKPRLTVPIEELECT